MPLLQALDEEVGIGFERASDFGAEASPLLRGIGLGAAAGEQNVSWGRTQALPARPSQPRPGGGGARDRDHSGGSRPHGAGRPAEAPSQPLPDAFHVMVTLAAASQEAIDAGDFQLLFENAGGPSGRAAARALLPRRRRARDAGRRAPARRGGAPPRRHLRRDRPSAAGADRQHPGAAGAARVRDPLPRPLGRAAGAADPVERPAGRRRGLADRAALGAARPRGDPAPDLRAQLLRGSLGVYRFLCILQSQGVLGGVGWSWGPLESAPFLPRVTCGRLVLSRASWWMTAGRDQDARQGQGDRPLPGGPGLAPEAQPSPPDRPRRRRQRAARRPRQRAVDRDLHRRRRGAGPGADRRVLPRPRPARRLRPRGAVPQRDPDPLRAATRRPGASVPSGGRARAAAPQAAVAAVVAKPLRRSFPPGSEWLYAKLYTGTATADGLLREVLDAGGARGDGGG